MAARREKNVDEGLKRIVREAAELAQEVPENLQQAAFSSIFAHLAGAPVGAVGVAAPAAGSAARTKRSPATAGRKQASSRNEAADRDGLVTAICQAVNSHARHDEIAENVLDKRSQAGRVLMCLYVAHELNLGAVRTTDIESITRQLRVKVEAANVAKVLREQLQRYVTQHGVRRRGQAVDYTISRAGEQAFEALLEGTSLNGARTSRTKPKTTAKKGKPPETKRAKTKDTGKKAAKKKTKKAAKKKAAKKTSGRSSRLSPRQHLDRLVADGFFGKAKTIADIVEHLETKRGHRVKANELSPFLLWMVRNGILDRAKNADGKYEYKTC